MGSKGADLRLRRILNARTKQAKKDQKILDRLAMRREDSALPVKADGSLRWNVTIKDIGDGLTETTFVPSESGAFSAKQTEAITKQLFGDPYRDLSWCDESAQQSGETDGQYSDRMNGWDGDKWDWED